MEARTSNQLWESDNRKREDIKQEALASPSEVPPLEDEGEEPPPLEEVSEPHSKASSPSGISEEFEKSNSPLSYSRKGYSPSSSPETVHSPTASYIEEIESPPSYRENGISSSPHTNKIDHLSPHADNLQQEGLENNIFPHYVQSLKHTDTISSGIRPDIGSNIKAGIGSSTTTTPIEKIDAKPSLRSSIPSVTHSVVSAAKHVSFKSRSLSSRSSSAIYGSSSWWKGSAHQMRIVEVALRFGGAILALITFSVMAATSEKRQGAGSTFTMKFTDYPAYSYLVAVNVISFVYSSWQLVLLGQSGFSGVFTTTRDNLLSTYICDQHCISDSSRAFPTWFAQHLAAGVLHVEPVAFLLESRCGCRDWFLLLILCHCIVGFLWPPRLTFFVGVRTAFGRFQPSHSRWDEPF